MRFKMIFASAAALAMAAGTPALAAKAPGQNQQIAASEAGGGTAEKKICRTFKNTVSRMKSEKLCMTRAAWKKFEAEQL
jgi:isocitrate dehydrogenase